MYIWIAIWPGCRAAYMYVYTHSPPPPPAPPAHTLAPTTHLRDLPATDHMPHRRARGNSRLVRFFIKFQDTPSELGIHAATHRTRKHALGDLRRTATQRELPTWDLYRCACAHPSCSPSPTALRTRTAWEELLECGHLALASAVQQPLT